MSDLNTFHKRICVDCNQEIDFIWSHNIYNNNALSQVCFECRELRLNELYSSQNQSQSD